jgi:XTP/dITP diphosphohydrolase
MDIVVATRNKGKLREIQAMLKGAGGARVRVLSLDDFPDCPEVVEDGATFRENALKKARAVAKFTGKLALADDSGLMVDALDGAPGIYSARFAGKGADDRKNNIKLLRLMKQVPERERGAQFVCVMALSGPEGSGIREKTVKGIVRGRILREMRGPGGFGYDPLFYYSRARMTFAEMGPDEKNKVSHRARALMKVKALFENN